MAATAAAAGGSGGTLEEKLVRVTLWLKKIYGDLPIPKYEVNERTVDILHDVMECNEETDREISLMIEDMKQQAIKDEEKTVYWQDVLREGLGLSVDNLSEEATAYLNDLVESAITLKVKDMSLASLFCAISDMTSELFETKSKTQELELELNNIQKKVTSAVMMEKRLQEDNFKIEESQRKENARILSRSKNLKFLKYKFEDLKISIKDAEELLIARGLNQSLTHEALMKFSEEVAALRKEVVTLKKKLEPYHKLPLSIALAKVKVEEAKTKLKTLDDELSEQIEALPFELT